MRLALLAGIAWLVVPSNAVAQCPPEGDAAPGSNHAITNAAKNQRVPAGATPTRITFNDLRALQTWVENSGLPMGPQRHMDQAQRQQLRSIQVGAKTLGEGTFVQLEGYVTAESKNPRYMNSGESVNCNIEGPEDNDIHLNIVADPEEDEFQGIVAEVIPRNRLKSYEVAKLRLVRDAERRIMVRGPLFFDNAHTKRMDPCDRTHVGARKVCINRDQPHAGNSARISLWEIHPVTEIRVCLRPQNNCSPANPAQWMRLQKVSDAKLKAFIAP